MRPLRVAIFASGTGSNAMALVNKAKSFSEQQMEISFVLSDKAKAPVLEKAQSAGVRTYLVEKKKDRSTHEEEILLLLREHRIDWILLAGYMRLLSPAFLQQFSKWHQGAGQVVNIHPSLLPAYPGIDSIAAAYKDCVEKSGVTIHLVDEGMDTGAILMQESLNLHESDSFESWAQKFHELEHRMYTSFLDELVSGQRKTCYFEENK
ncbi:MAG: phosphoribosylglycinamide formyltransferase [Pseudobdellovibrionaceae bacterium]